jgi:uncharacterized Zn-binding protein involved in type VI secretion
MPRRHAPLIAAILVVSCRSDITPSEPPFLRGIITSRAAFLYGVQDGTGTRIDSVPAMFVDGVGIWPASEPCAAQAKLAISGQTEVLRNGFPADTGQLTIGQKVSVWITAIVLRSCPPQASAARVVLEDSFDGR